MFASKLISVVFGLLIMASLFTNCSDDGPGSGSEQELRLIGEWSRIVEDPPFVGTEDILIFSVNRTGRGIFSGDEVYSESVFTWSIQGTNELHSYFPADDISTIRTVEFYGDTAIVIDDIGNSNSLPSTFYKR